jgi:hypothetical protein
MGIVRSDGATTARRKRIVRQLISALEEAMRYGRPAYSRSGKHCTGCDDYHYTLSNESSNERARHERGCETARLEKLLKDAKAVVNELT